MRLHDHLVTFAADLTIFAAGMRSGHCHLQDGLRRIAVRLPEMVEDDRFVVVGSVLHEALALAATLLALSRHRGAAPARAIGHLERRVTRLFELGAGVERPYRRPTGRMVGARHRLRRGSLPPAPIRAHGRG